MCVFSLGKIGLGFLGSHSLESSLPPSLSKTEQCLIWSAPIYFFLDDGNLQPFFAHNNQKQPDKLAEILKVLRHIRGKKGLKEIYIYRNITNNSP